MMASGRLIMLGVKALMVVMSDKGELSSDEDILPRAGFGYRNRRKRGCGMGLSGSVASKRSARHPVYSMVVSGSDVARQLQWNHVSQCGFEQKCIVSAASASLSIDYEHDDAVKEASTHSEGMPWGKGVWRCALRAASASSRCGTSG